MLKSLSEEKGQDATFASKFTIKFHKLYSVSFPRDTVKMGCYNPASSFEPQVVLQIPIIHLELRVPLLSLSLSCIFQFLVAGNLGSHENSINLGKVF